MTKPKRTKDAAAGRRIGACRLCGTTFQDRQGNYLAPGTTAPDHNGRNGKKCPLSGTALIDGS
ncbi:hypothetical protein [Embleya sp. NPDC005971]|uniref:hypothetical protein n=1 Tax=Embleya sp. NPDC005971 TaxID=3156724 RepID=UPI0033E2D6EE